MPTREDHENITEAYGEIRYIIPSPPPGDYQLPIYSVPTNIFYVQMKNSILSPCEEQDATFKFMSKCLYTRECFNYNGLK